MLNKYLKYKKKYFDLKKIQFGGASNQELIHKLMFIGLIKFDLRKKYITESELVQVNSRINILENNCLSIILPEYEVMDNIMVKEVSIDVNVSYNGVTSLMMQSRCGYNLYVIEWLLQNGANINAQDNNKNTALNYAVFNKNFYIIRLLLEYGANITKLVLDQCIETYYYSDLKFNLVTLAPLAPSINSSTLIQDYEYNLLVRFIFDSSWENSINNNVFSKVIKDNKYIFYVQIYGVNTKQIKIKISTIKDTYPDDYIFYQTIEIPIQILSKYRYKFQIKLINIEQGINIQVFKIDIIDSLPSGIHEEINYQEKQDQLLCAKHALNHIFQEEKIVWDEKNSLFIHGDDIMDSKTKLNLYLYCKESEKQKQEELKSYGIDIDVSKMIERLQDPEPKITDDYYEQYDNTYTSIKNGKTSRQREFDYDLKNWINNRQKYMDNGVINKEYIRNKIVAEKTENFEQIITCDLNPPKGNLPFDWISEILKYLNYDFIEKTIDELEILNNENCIGLIVLIGVYHYIAITKFHTMEKEKCIFAIADSMAKNIFTCYKDINSLKTYFLEEKKKDNNNRFMRSIAIIANENSYRSVAIRRMKMKKESNQFLEHQQKIIDYNTSLDTDPEINYKKP